MIFHGEDDRLLLVEWIAVFETTKDKNREDIRNEWLSESDEFIDINFRNMCSDFGQG